MTLQIEVNPKHWHGNMPGWDASGVDIATMRLIRGIVLNNLTDSADYKAKRGSGVFLQAYDEASGFIMLEFWEPTYHPFVHHLNAELRSAE